MARILSAAGSFLPKRPPVMRPFLSSPILKKGKENDVFSKENGALSLPNLSNYAAAFFTAERGPVSADATPIRYVPPLWCQHVQQHGVVGRNAAGRELLPLCDRCGQLGAHGL